jgi:hypothetical protein
MCAAESSNGSGNVTSQHFYRILADLSQENRERDTALAKVTSTIDSISDTVGRLDRLAQRLDESDRERSLTVQKITSDLGELQRTLPRIMLGDQELSEVRLLIRQWKEIAEGVTNVRSGVEAQKRINEALSAADSAGIQAHRELLTRVESQKVEIGEQSQRVYALELTRLSEEKHRQVLKVIDEWEQFRDEYLARTKKTVDEWEAASSDKRTQSVANKSTFANALVQVVLIAPFTVLITILAHQFLGGK